MKYTHILWDFNGTILDDVRCGIDSVNVLLLRRGMKTVESIEEYHSVFGFPIVDYYKKLGFDFDKEPYGDIAIEWVKEYNARSPFCPLCPGVEKALDAFDGYGADQLILTASEENMVLGQLTALGIRDRFSSVLACDNIHAYGKTAIALDWVNRVKPQRAVLIGDTEHDHDVAVEMGIESVLVAAGHLPYSKLALCGCPVFRTLDEAVAYIISNE